MTTFTMQDLTPVEVPRETKEALREILNTRSISNLPITPEEDEMFKTMAEMSRETQHAPVPQPSQVSPEAVIEDMVAKFSISLRLLLTTIVNQPKPQPEAGTNVPSLQETVALTLQQADWFKDMVRETIVDEVSLEDVMKDIVKDEIESAVDSYFRNEFDPTYHFDFGDAVCSEVSDQLDDVVRDRLDEVVQEQLEEVVAEKLKSIRVVFD